MPKLLLILMALIEVGTGSALLIAPSLVVELMLAALSVSGAIFLILELNTPFNGMMQISDAPFVSALAHLGQ